MTGIQIAWELVRGESCCCGKPDCDGGWSDRWAWVARSDEHPLIMASSDNSEEARAMAEVLVRCREEGRVPSADEVTPWRSEGGKAEMGDKT